MKIIEEVVHIMDTVEHFLTNYPDFRDSDNKLIAQIWWSQLVDKKMSARDFLLHIGNKNLVNPESVRRCRQKLQQEHEHLRGENYKVRHEDADEFKQQILQI